MRVQLHGTHLLNTGDVLMLQAAVAQLSAHHALEISNDRDTSPEAVVDVCGYWCGDPWGPDKANRMAEAVTRWKQLGGAFLLLPQTFGPFQNPEVRAAAQTIIEHADLVCARDTLSRAMIEEAFGALPSLRSFPDYTCDVAASPSRCRLNEIGDVAIIPNQRMIDKASPEDAAAYRPLLLQCITQLKTHHLRPFLLVHEHGDETLARSIAHDAGGLHVVTHHDPRVLKGTISRCKAVVSSRYHGLINAFTQGVPAVAIGWCHKYPALLSDFGCSECLLEVTADAAACQRAIDCIADEHSRMPLRERLKEGKYRYKSQTRALWMEVLGVLEARASAADG